MSMERMCEVTCPKCGYTQSVQVWDTLNVTLDPHGRDLLFAGELNTLHCAQCGQATFIDMHFMYHDMERQFMVWYFPSYRLNEKDFYEDFTSEGILRVDHGQTSYFSHPHMVFDPNELLRYITFRERLQHVISEKMFVVEGHQVFERDIEAQNIKVIGKVVGNLTAQDLVEVVSSGTVIGNITAQRVIVAEGAVFKGQVYFPQK